MSGKGANEGTRAVERADAVEESEDPPKIPEGVVRAAEQLNRGESVSKEKMLAGLDELSDTDE